MAQIYLEKINKIYDNGFQAVFDLNINDREFLVIVGPSGCGKSTMLRIIAGLEVITKGKMFIDGELVNNKTPKQRGIAMIFQSYALYPHLNVYENMAFGLTLEGYDEDFIEKRVKETALVLGLSDYLDRKPRELSGGQCQRVAVGRAIIRYPKVFLMDEPLSNLDAKQRTTMRSEIIEIHRKTNATTIYVTHDQVEAMTMADRIVVMKDGYIQQVGTPHELYFHPANRFVAGFIGDPPMNFLPCSLSNGTAFIKGCELSFDFKKLFPDIASRYNKQDIILGFRPEAITTCGDKDVPNSLILAAQTELTELLGDNANVYAYMGNNRIILRVSPYNIPPINCNCNFAIPYTSLYVFDAQTNMTINS